MPKWQICRERFYKMAKKSKFVAPAGVNMAILAAIAAGPDGIGYVSQADGLPLVNFDPQLIEVNPAQVDAIGNAAARLTDAGRQLLAAAQAGGSNPAPVVAGEAKPSPYGLITNAVLPPSKRGNKGGGAPTVYPFETMEIGQSFFVPVSEKHPDPVKTLGSTVSSANMRFAVKTGEMKTVERSKRGAKNKLVLDATGAKIMETVQVPVYKHMRKFSIRPVVAGVQYGEWVAPANGALIARVELKTE
jgi:hypothetical protein